MFLSGPEFPHLCILSESHPAQPIPRPPNLTLAPALVKQQQHRKTHSGWHHLLLPKNALLTSSCFALLFTPKIAYRSSVRLISSTSLMPSVFSFDGGTSDADEEAEEEVVGR